MKSDHKHIFVKMLSLIVLISMISSFGISGGEVIPQEFGSDLDENWREHNPDEFNSIENHPPPRDREEKDDKHNMIDDGRPLDHQNFKNQIEHLERELRRNPRDISLITELGDVLVENNKLNAAIEVYKTGTRVASNDPVIWQRLGHAYNRKGKQNLALNAFKRAKSHAYSQDHKMRIQDHIDAVRMHKGEEPPFLFIAVCLVILILFILFRGGSKEEPTLSKPVVNTKEVQSFKGKAIEQLILNLATDFTPSTEVPALTRCKDMQQGYELVEFSITPDKLDTMTNQVSRRISSLGDYTFDLDPTIHRELDKKAVKPIIHEHKYGRATNTETISQVEKSRSYGFVMLGIFIALILRQTHILFLPAGLGIMLYGFFFYKITKNYYLKHGMWVILDADTHAHRNLCEGRFKLGGELILQDVANKKHIERLSEKYHGYGTYNKVFDKFVALINQIVSQYEDESEEELEKEKTKKKVKKKDLPKKCPDCGGKLNPDKFNSMGKIVCPYCDSTIG